MPAGSIVPALQWGVSPCPRVRSPSRMTARSRSCRVRTRTRQPSKQPSPALAELVCPTAGQRVYRLTAAALWRARRAGLTLEEVLQTLETASTTALPPQVRADLERWSRQIDRLTLEADQGRLVLRRPIPWSSPRCSGIARSGPSSPTNVMPPRWRCGPTPIRHWSRPSMPVAIPSWTACPQGGSPRLPQCCRRPPRCDPVVQLLPAPTGRRRAARVEGLRRLPRQCQATTQAGRRCKNRVQPGSQFLPGACAVVPAGAVPGPVHPAGPPGHPAPGRQAGTWACATATAGGVPCHRPHGHRAPHLAAVAPPEVAR